MKTNFQSESTKSGKQFEENVCAHLAGLHDISLNKIIRHVRLDSLGIELDYCIPGLEAGEAKGGASGKKKRPGAQRTDNVKKAIANGALFKTLNPNTRFVVYFSAKPKPGSASEAMLETAISNGFIDQVRYITYT